MMKKLITSLAFVAVAACSETVVVEVPNPDQNLVDQIFSPEESDSVPDNSELPLDTFGVIDLPTGGIESVPGHELVGDFSYEPVIDDNGISIQITSFGFLDTGDPRLTLRLDNQSDSVIDFAFCNLQVLQTKDMVSRGIVSFGGLGFIDPGDVAIGLSNFFDELTDGFNSFNELQLDCSWSNEDPRIDLQTVSDRLEFLGYGISSRGIASATLRRSNESEESSPLLFCNLEAKVGRVILDVANIGFPPADPGEVQESTGNFSSFSTLQGFRDDEFDFSNLDCEYRS